MKVALVLFLTFLCGWNCALLNEKGTEISSSSKNDLTKAIMENMLKEEELLLSDGKKDILSVIFDENVLKHSGTEFLIRLFDTEMRGIEILPGRKREIETALREKIRQVKGFEEILSLLSYAYTNQFKHALFLIVDTVNEQTFNNLMNYLKYLDFTFYEHLKAVKSNLEKDTESDSDDEYDKIDDSIWKEEDRPIISIEVFKELTNEYRLPAYIRYITNLPVSNDQVNSKFIKENVLSQFDLGIICVLYELEMMDNLHTHDTEAVIESHLKKSIFYDSNENMANLAWQLHNEGYDKALKLLLDQKFSYKSPISNAWWFQDLSWLFNYGKEHYFADGFYQKVLSLAKPSAVRRYVSKVGNNITEPSKILDIINDINNLDDDEEAQIIEFRNIK